MHMITTFGKMPTKKPKGFFKAVEFPVLAFLDKKTGDRRMLLSDGANTRDLPLSIKFASKTSYGHEGAEVSGALFEVTIDPEKGVMSGKGFLLDDENGRRHARLIHTGAMNGNSVDLADIKARFVEDMENGDYWIEFTQFNLAATTGVATPAFAGAHATVEELDDDELTAALGDGPLVCTFADDAVFTIHVEGVDDVLDEIEASAAPRPNRDLFFTPEADQPTKIVVTADGHVYGHLALWNSCHDGYSDRCMTVPRPSDSYASFNKAGVLTDRGQVETGPIFALGGHRPAKSAKTIEEAYGGIENAWCDVRVIEGRFGPWLSGVVRPGVTDEIVYAARASRISGHWVNGRLKAIVSVNAEGFDVPGSGREMELVAGFAFSMTDGVPELVASLPGCVDAPAETVPTNQLTLTFAPDVDVNSIAYALTQTTSGFAYTITPNTTYGYASAITRMTTEAVVEAAADETDEVADSVDDDRRWADERLAELLLDDD